MRLLALCILVPEELQNCYIVHAVLGESLRLDFWLCQKIDQQLYICNLLGGSELSMQSLPRRIWHPEG